MPTASVTHACRPVSNPLPPQQWEKMCIHPPLGEWLLEAGCCCQ